MAMTGCASYAVAADTIKIALDGPVAGAVAQDGEMQCIGAKMAREQINKDGQDHSGKQFGNLLSSLIHSAPLLLLYFL